MQTTNNADTVAKSLETYLAETKRKLESMVAGFAGDVAYQAAISTPRATDEYVATHESLYQVRLNKHGIPKQPGFHQGSWQFSNHGLTVRLEPEINTVSEVEYRARTKAQAQYRLGDSFVIGTESPNMLYLNRRDGIQEAVIDSSARAAYMSNLQSHFNRG